MKRAFQYALEFKSILVIYAALDLAFTIAFVTSRYNTLFENEMAPLYPAVYWYAYPFLLLVACIAIRVNRWWSNLLAVVMGLWLIKKILVDWAQLAQGQGSSMLSWPTINFWWNDAALYRWNLIRLPIAILVVICSTSQFISTIVGQRKLV